MKLEVGICYSYEVTKRATVELDVDDDLDMNDDKGLICDLAFQEINNDWEEVGETGHSKIVEEKMEKKLIESNL